MKILVTGAGGFVGRQVCDTAAARGHRVVAVSRQPVSGFETVSVGEVGPDTDWSPALAGIDAVIHLAARAHVMNDTESDPLAVFRRVNRDGAVRLAEQARECGVGRFVFVSSIKVNGESTPKDQPFTATMAPAPQDAYGLAKAEAEAALSALGLPSLAIVRPPLVHGPHAKGNLATLMKVLAKGYPLPLGGIDNRRSLIGLENLADALVFLAETNAAGTFLVRDDEDVSTSQLLTLLGEGLGRPARLFRLPPVLFRLLGRSGTIRRLTGSLVVDDSPLRQLGWQPPVTLKDGLHRMAEARRNAP